MKNRTLKQFLSILNPDDYVRVEVSGCALSPDGTVVAGLAEADAEFFGVYLRGTDGCAAWVIDCPTRDRAEEVVKEIGQWLVS